MNSSPYFSRARGRRVQSAAKAAAATLGSKRRTRKHVKVEYESDAKAARVEKKESERNTAKRSGKDNSARQTDEAVQWEPARWRDQLVNIREMRKNRDAPVDSQGCEKAADSNEAPEVSDVSCLQTLQCNANVPTVISNDRFV